MQITLDNIGKRYQKEWIFRNISTKLSSGNNYLIKGLNGSGKSTLLQVIAGNKVQTEGNIHFRENDVLLPRDSVFRKLSVATPYQELIEEFSLEETIEFHGKLKPFIKGLDTNNIIEISGLEKSADKKLSGFSSGMRQRVRLVLAVLSDVPLVFLDEPLSNLDKRSTDWYKELIEKYMQDRLFIVCSNENKDEFYFCNESIDIMQYKK